MKVTIDVSPAVHHRAGMGRHAAELVNALEVLAGEQDALQLQVFYTEAGRADPQAAIATLPQYQSRLAYKPWRLSAMMSHFLRLPFDRVYGSPDIVHATDHLLPHVHAASVFTLHDLIFELFPQYHKKYNYYFLKLMMPRFLRAANQIICVSEHSKKDAVRLYGIDPAKISVIYNAVDPRYHVKHDAASLIEVRQRYALPESFLLHVGTIEPRKNLSRLLDAFATLKEEFEGLKLVLVGQKGWLYEPFFEKLAEMGLESEVILPGFVPEADLPAIFQLATLFVYPSIYEGFGLPPLEALAGGTPVVCSNASSLPEVVGSAGLLVPPHDTHALTAALRRLLSDPDLQAKLKYLGPLQAASFTWEEAARQTVKVYEKCP